MDNKEEIKKMIMSGSIDSTIFKILAQSLTEGELLTLVQDLNDAKCSNTSAIGDLKWILQNISSVNLMKKMSMSEMLRRNESIKQLLDWYNDKKSGKVIYARKRLQERFLHLEYTDQITVAKTFLSGGKMDRLWCYNTLRKWWSDELTQAIIDVWNMYHEERCGWLFPKYLPIHVIREYLDELCYDSNYYQICKRLVTEPWFKIDKTRLLGLVQNYQYMWIMSLTTEGLSSEEAMQVITKSIEECVVLCNNLDEFNIEEINKRISIDLYNCTKDNCMVKINKMEQMLVSMCRMGLYENVIVVIKKDRKFQRRFKKLHELEYERLFELKYTKDVEPLKNELLKKLAQFYLEHYPLKYVGLKQKTESEDKEESLELEDINKEQTIENPNSEECSSELCSGNDSSTTSEELVDTPESYVNANPIIKDLIEVLDMEIISVSKRHISTQSKDYLNHKEELFQFGEAKDDVLPF